MPVNFVNSNYFKKKIFSLKQKKNSKFYNIQIPQYQPKIDDKNTNVTTGFFEIKTIRTYFSKLIPYNMNFETGTTITKINKSQNKSIILQFPEGLDFFAPILFQVYRFQIFESFIGFVVNKPTFGACCVEDSLADFYGCDLLIHFGHSCLVPVIESLVFCSYIFVEIFFDLTYLCESLLDFFIGTCLKASLFGTIQFSFSLERVKEKIKYFFNELTISRVKPLSKGEILGCTSNLNSKLLNYIFVGDGRFHIESGLLSNGKARFATFNPFNQCFSIVDFFSIRTSLKRNKLKLFSRIFRSNFIIIYSLLGKQTNRNIVRKIEEIIKNKNLVNQTFYCEEINRNMLACYKKGSLSFLQIACPRLSLDWCLSFQVNLLSTFDIKNQLTLEEEKIINKMDLYSDYTNFTGAYYKSNKIYFFITIKGHNNLKELAAIKKNEYFQ
mmetsp:Transcript_18747/g.29261  ORF Transcript_18747/g.29261 Transcript_18747/m.29261 type:complete len:440 (+) Transcript_18747:1409-2728(+)